MSMMVTAFQIKNMQEEMGSLNETKMREHARTGGGNKVMPHKHFPQAAGTSDNKQVAPYSRTTHTLHAPQYF